MIKRSRAKRLVAVALSVALLLGSAGLVFLLGQVTVVSSTGSDASSGLTEVATVPEDADQLVTWSPDEWTRERSMEPATRKMITAAYIRAWAAIGRFQSTGEEAAVVDTFSGPARRTVVEMPRTDSTATWTLHHTVVLEFYALDGATVAFRDTGASVVRSVGSGRDQLITTTAENFDVVMVLEDGFWRVRQLQRGAVAEPVLVSVPAEGQSVVTNGPNPEPLATPPSLSTDYVPESWATPDAANLTTDLSRAKDLGFDTIRVALPYVELGAATPSRSAIATVQMLLAEAERQQLSVELVLFDGLDDLSPANWSGAGRHVEALVAAVQDSPALVLWDLADRPDLRIGGGASASEVHAFLLFIGDSLRTLDPDTPQTISWSSAQSAADSAMAAPVDLVSIHLIGTGGMGAAIERMQQTIIDRPLRVTVTALSTHGGWSPSPRTENWQSAEIAAVLRTASDATITRISVAELYDSADYQGGVLRLDGSEKASATLIGDPADLGSAAAPGFNDYAQSKFWRGALALVVVSVAAWIWWWRRVPLTRHLADRRRHRADRPIS